jgi:3-hydroxybutyryl-CoA dehydrogenase
MGVSDAFLLVEAISENILSKEKLFNQLDKLTNNNCILASNTSSISITALASFTNRPEKVIGMHFMNPVPVMPLIEIIPGLLTDKEVTDKVIEISALLNKTPLVVSDFPGFISNRILMPMINEAILSLQENVAGVNEIDQIMKLGMAHPMGPLQLADYIGLDVCLSILNVLKDGFGNPKYAPAVLLVNMVKAGKLGVKSGEGFYKYNDVKKILGVSALFAN